ncbi:MAG: ATP-binding protein [Chloroflexota bacterium]
MRAVARWPHHESTRNGRVYHHRRRGSRTGRRAVKHRPHRTKSDERSPRCLCGSHAHRGSYAKLTDNAIKFMGDQANPQIEVGATCQANKCVCFIRDNGMGIDPRYHDKVFGLFDRLDPSIEGTGIGLALVKRIIEVHNGRIWVESEGSGKGSTFFFTLPREAPGV